MAENGYAKPVLVTSDWVAEHAGDDNIVVAEVDENPDLYEEGHIPGAVKLHWREDLQDPVERDVIDRETFERLVRGIFLQRRKMLLNALKPVAETFGRSSADLIAAAGVDGTKRPQELTLRDIAQLSRAVL